MESSLDSVLSEEPVVETTVTETPPDTSEVVTETVTDDAQVTGDEKATTPVDKQQDEIDKHRKGLEAAALAERRKRQDLEREIAQLRQQQAQPKTPTDRPQLANFGTQEEYLAAVADYEADRAWKQREETDKQRRLQEAEEQHLGNLKRTADEIVTKGKAKYADFDAVINDSLAPYLSPAMHQTLLLSEQGHEVAYWLGKNPAEAARLCDLPPLQLARELAFIETRLQAAPVKEKPQLPETLTQARDTRGRFETTAYSGPTPLDAILANK